MADTFPYPPCTPGIFSEKPRRHDFEIILDSNGKALLRQSKNGRLIYHTACKNCGLNDPNPPRF